MRLPLTILFLSCAFSVQAMHRAPSVALRTLKIPRTYFATSQKAQKPKPLTASDVENITYQTMRRFEQEKRERLKNRLKNGAYMAGMGTAIGAVAVGGIAWATIISKVISKILNS